MVVTKESKGNVICENKSKAHLQMNGVSDHCQFYTDETGLFTSKTMQELEGGMGKKHEHIKSFHRNAAISDILSAAAAAAARRLTSSNVDLDELADAVRVLEIVEEQRAFVQDQIVEEQKIKTTDPELGSQSFSDLKQTTNTVKTNADSLDDRIQAARKQANQPCFDSEKSLQKHSVDPDRA